MSTDKQSKREAARQQVVQEGNVWSGSMGHWLDEVMNEAHRRGDFDDLPGKGRPLDLGDPDPFAGPDAEAYKVLKNAGFTPEWVDLRKQIIKEIEWLRANPQSPLRPSRIVETNILIDKHNRQIPSPSLMLGKLPRTFGQEA